MNSAQRVPESHSIPGISFNTRHDPIDPILKNLPVGHWLRIEYNHRFFGHLHHHCNWRPYFRLDSRGSQAPVFYRSFFPLRLSTCIKKNCLQMGLVSNRSVQIQVQTLRNKFTTLWNVMYFCPAQCTQLHFRWFGSVAISLHCQYDRHTKVWFTRISV